jgi:hypothetical protein
MQKIDLVINPHWIESIKLYYFSFQILTCCCCIFTSKKLSCPKYLQVTAFPNRHAFVPTALLTIQYPFPNWKSLNTFYLEIRTKKVRFVENHTPQLYLELVWILSLETCHFHP